MLRKTCVELGATIVMVSHDPRAASYADRVVFIKDDKIVKELKNEVAGHNVQPITDVFDNRNLAQFTRQYTRWVFGQHHEIRALVRRQTPLLLFFKG